MPRRLVFALSSDYARRTGGWVYSQRLLQELGARGWQVERLALPAGFPDPSPAARAQAARILGSLAGDTLLMTDQICLSVMPGVARVQGRRLRLVLLLHHPLADEGGRSEVETRRLARMERDTLAHVCLVVVTSASTAHTLQGEYDVPPHRLLVAPPGTDALALAAGSASGPLALTAVGAVIPRKGHDILVQALAGLLHESWRLTIVGNIERAPAHVAALRAQIAAADLTGRITLAGELEEEAANAQWAGTDVFVSASRHEGFGMAVAEAVARGLPVVTTRAGAVGDWLGAPAAIVVPDADPLALGSALARVLTDARLRLSMRQAALAWRPRLPAWEVTASLVDRALARLCAVTS